MARRTRLSLHWARLAIALGASPADKARIALLMLMGPIRRRRGKRKETTLRLRSADCRPVEWHVGSDTDLKVFSEIVRGDYALDLPHPPQVVVDLGAHTGAASMYFSQRYPGARIVGIEADPATFRLLAQNVSKNSSIEIHNIAVASKEGPISFYTSSDSWVSSTRRARPWQHAIQVLGRRLDDILAEAGIADVDLLKIDIEGSEFDVLPTFAGGLRSVNAIVGEIHPGPDRALDEITGLLGDFALTLEPSTDTGTVRFKAIRKESPAPPDGAA